MLVAMLRAALGGAILISSGPVSAANPAPGADATADTAAAQSVVPPEPASGAPPTVGSGLVEQYVDPTAVWSGLHAPDDVKSNNGLFGKLRASPPKRREKKDPVDPC